MAQYIIDGAGKFAPCGPVFIHTQTQNFTVLLKKADGTPFDLTDYRAQCALKQNFIHGPGQELIAYALGTITAPESGAIDFSVECRSELFYNAVKNGTATCYFEISLIPSGVTDSVRIAFDTVTLQPRVQVDEGEPQQAGPEYPTFAQVNSLMDEREFAPGGGNPGDVLTKTETGQAWAELPAGGVTSVNGETGDVSLDAADVGAISTGGMVIETLTSGVIPAPGKVYNFAPSSDVELTFPTPISNQTTAFKLRIAMPDPAVTVTFPSNLAWKFATPTLAAGTTSELAFVWNGSSWEGWATPDLSEYMPKSGGTFTGRVTYPDGLILGYSSGNPFYLIAYHATLTVSQVHTTISNDRVDISSLYGDININPGSPFPYPGNYHLNFRGHHENTPGGFCITDATTGNLTIPGDLTFTPANATEPTTLSALIARIEALEQAQN